MTTGYKNAKCCYIVMSGRKTLNMYQQEDIQLWNDLKREKIEEEDDPDVKDIDLLRDVLQHYNECDIQ